MTNQNDVTAETYDVVSSYVKNSSITLQEISLMSFYTLNKSLILDIGGGTGRHGLILSELGHNITLIDSSKAMLKILLNKIKLNTLELKGDIRLINKDFFNFKSKNKFDLIILMWNSFNEIVLTKKNALRFFSKLKKMLKINGTIIINIDDAKIVDPSKFKFDFEVMKEDKKYSFTWETVKYFKRTNTSISKETIVLNNRDTKIETQTTYIKQRYWSIHEISSLLKKNNFQFDIKNIKGNSEHYIIIKHII